MSIRRIALIAGIGMALSMGALTASAQVQYDIFVDEFGQEVLVDPYTGEIVGILEDDRGFDIARELTPRQARREARQRERQRRRARLQQELEALFELEPETPLVRQRGTVRLRSARQQNRSRRNEPRLGEIIRETLPEPQTRIARLPDPKRDEGVTRPRITSPNLSREQVTALQVFLDSEGFSPGVIDGGWGGNVAKAVVAWQEAKGKSIDITDPRVLARYQKGSVYQSYTLTKADLAGPFVASIPQDYAQKAAMRSMAYTSPLEMLAERFHMSEAHLKRLNPGVLFNHPGTRIKVVKQSAAVTRKVHYIIADKGREQLRAYDRNGALVSAYPATIGSASTPSPSGKVEVARIALDPNYTYNPKKNFKQGNNDKILTIPPGPNGPVGSVWIALSKPTYGIHGTPNPSLIGKTNSHGCIRLTNWDAQELASLVRKGVTVEFVE